MDTPNNKCKCGIIHEGFEVLPDDISWFDKSLNEDNFFVCDRCFLNNKPTYLLKIDNHEGNTNKDNMG